MRQQCYQMIDVIGPKPPLVDAFDAAPQLPLFCHSQRM